MADEDNKTFDKNANGYTVVFAVTICVVLAVCLAAAFNGLNSRIKANKRFDKQVNVLIAVGLHKKSEQRSRKELQELYNENIKGEVLHVIRSTETRVVKEGGEIKEREFDVVQDVKKTDIPIAELETQLREERRKPPIERRELVPFYRRVDEDGKDIAYCIPIDGYGLWSTLYGYLALGADLNTVQGITFYQHGETPGLGGEVDNFNWQEQWQGKKIRDDEGKIVSVTVKKGQVDEQVPEEKAHMVDGLSGATITSNGVTKFVANDLETYEPYFQKLLGKGE